MVADLDDLLNTYRDPRRDPWTAGLLPRLQAIAAERGGLARLAETVGMSERRLRDVLNGLSRPRAAARIAMEAFVTALPTLDGKTRTI